MRSLFLFLGLGTAFTVDLDCVTNPLVADEPSSRNSVASDPSGDRSDKASDVVALRLQKYFEGYCDYTGGMERFIPGNNYDYEFRQHLKTTDDQELKRLFVLQHLYRDVDSAMRDYERGVVRVGKNQYDPMTAAKKLAVKRRLTATLDDLKSFNPTDPLGRIDAFRKKLN